MKLAVFSDDMQFLTIRFDLFPALKFAGDGRLSRDEQTAATERIGLLDCVRVLLNPCNTRCGWYKAGIRKQSKEEINLVDHQIRSHTLVRT